MVRAPALAPSLDACPQPYASEQPDKGNPSGVRYPPHQGWYFRSEFIIFPSLVPGSVGQKAVMYNIFAVQEDYNMFGICPGSLPVTSRNRKSCKIFKSLYYHGTSLSYSNIKM